MIVVLARGIIRRSTLQATNFMKLFSWLLFILAALMTSSAQAQSTPTADHWLQGDVGLGLFHTPAITATHDSANSVMPYIFADAGPFYGRLDTFGVKLTPMGNGHLELAARLSFEGYHSSIAGIQDRARPLPIGVGTFQRGDWGAVIAYAFYDQRSGGTLLDATYAARFSLGKITLYPQLGVERRSQAYVQSLYGVSATEQQASNVHAYEASSAISPNIAMAAEYPINEHYSLNFYAKHKWLGSIADSPLVQTKSVTSSFIALTRSFN
jgi:outer membrane protein